MAKLIAAEEARAGLRHAVVYPNVSGRTKEKIAQSKLVRSTWLTSHKWRELVSFGCLVCRCHDVFLWCYLCFVLLRFHLNVCVEAEALRSIILRYTGAPIATSVFFVFFLLFILRFLFFRVLFVQLSVSLCMESTSYVLSFRMGFSYPFVITGWIFGISLLCENF